MAGSSLFCGICNLRHITKPPVVWCSECDEGLCVACAEHHSLSAATWQHNTISITEYQKLPSDILGIREYCQEHNEKLQLFCKQHDCPCCRLCAVDSHSKCESVTAIERVIQNVKTSDTFQETEHLLSEMLETIGKIRKNRTDNLSSIQQQRQTVETEIKEAKRKIIKHIDKVQEILMNELVEVETKVTKQTTEVLSFLKEEEKLLKDYQTTMSSVKQYASDLQTFLSFKRIELDVASKGRSVERLLKTDTMNTTTLAYQPDGVVPQFQANILTLGKVAIQSLPCQINVIKQKDKQAQIMVISRPPRTVQHITLTLQQTINTWVDDTRGCALLADGRMMFSDYKYSQGRVRSINEDGSEDFDTGRLPTYTFDMAYIEDTNTIAVTSGDTQCINIIDMDSGEVKKVLQVNSCCDGIVYRNNTLIYSARYRGLRMIHLNDESVSDLNVSQIPSYAYVATFGDTFYYTNTETNTVTCCDLMGNTQWQFKDESILECPLGITVDNDGNVYVVGYNSSNVIVISSDGQLKGQLLSKKDGLDWPQVLHYESSTNRLLVVNKRGFAFLFQVARSN